MRVKEGELVVQWYHSSLTQCLLESWIFIQIYLKPHFVHRTKSWKMKKEEKFFNFTLSTFNGTQLGEEGNVFSFFLTVKITENHCGSWNLVRHYLHIIYYLLFWILFFPVHVRNGTIIEQRFHDSSHTSVVKKTSNCWREPSIIDCLYLINVLYDRRIVIRHTHPEYFVSICQVRVRWGLS